MLEDYHGINGITAEIQEHSQKKNYEELAFDILEKHLKKHKKKIVLLLDNLGDTLKKLDKTEVRRLREILQTRAFIRLIAATPFYLEETIDYHQPFYEFFKLIRVDSLNSDETKKLLRKLARINGAEEKINKIIRDTPERIEVLRTLTGGVPRTIVLMFNIFLESDEDSSVKDLERILDAVTPLYKHRMDDLPAQQQKIVHAVAISWDAISVKDLKDKVRLESKVVSAQLQQLEKNQVIDKVETSTKNNLYLLRERFFNIWYLMRYGRKDDKQRVLWLVRFLESWCSPEDMKIRIHNYVKKVKGNQIDEKAAELFGRIYSVMNNIDTEDKILLKRQAPGNVAQAIRISNKELSREMEKYAARKEWIKVLKFGSHLTTLTKQNKKDISVGVLELFPRNLASVFKNFDPKRKSETIDKSTAGEIEIMFVAVFLMLDWSLRIEKVEKIDTLMAMFFQWLSLENNPELGSGTNFVTQIICRLLANKQFNLALNLFTQEQNLFLQDRYKSLYYAIIYLKAGPGSTEYLKSAPELQESIKQILRRVEDLQKESIR